MKLRTLLLLSTLLAAFAFAQQRIEYISRMTGSGKGKVTWKTRDNGGQLQAELEAEGENLRRNSSYTLNVANGKFIQKVVTNQFGRFHVAKTYRGTVRPSIKLGDRTILTDAAGVPVQVGMFVNKR